MYTSNPLVGLAEVPSLLDQRHCGKGEFSLSPTLQRSGDGWSGPKSQQSQACASLCLLCPHLLLWAGRRRGVGVAAPDPSLLPASPKALHDPRTVAEQALHHPPRGLPQLGSTRRATRSQGVQRDTELVCDRGWLNCTAGFCRL